MDQGRVDWPNMWKKQPWNKFDLGFLPGKHWKKCGLILVQILKLEQGKVSLR